MSGADEQVDVLPRARRQVRRAIAWYHEQNPCAAVEFDAAFEQALVVLAEAPLRWAELEPGVRRYLMPRHPYTLIYTTQSAQVAVLAVVHHARHPDIWRRGP